MKKPRDLFTREELEKIKMAVGKAESVTSGEIRVKIISRCRQGFKPKDEALCQVYEKGLDKTKDKTGVLIFIVLKHRAIEILADKGINDKVSPKSWDKIAEGISRAFNKKDFCNGLCGAVEKAGEHLKTHFPIQPDDTNELPNDVILGK